MSNFTFFTIKLYPNYGKIISIRHLKFELHLCEKMEAQCDVQSIRRFPGPWTYSASWTHGALQYTVHTVDYFEKMCKKIGLSSP